VIQRYQTATLSLGTGAQPWRARVEDVEERRFAVKLSSVGQMGRPVPLRAGDLVRVILTGEDALYEFETKVLSEQAGWVYLEIPKRSRRVQRRQFAREACLLPVQFRIYDGPPPFSGARPPLVEGTALNISAGGLLLAARMTGAPGDLLELRVELDRGWEPVEVRGVVLNVVPPAPPRKEARHHVKFVEISDQVREQLIRYVIDRQRRARRIWTR
jgi:c-di-GMP-binding flagellar brake protein YcgR